MTSTTPVEIRREGTDALVIRWSDASISRISSEVLRLHCPCAACKEARGDTSHSTPLSPPKKPSTLRVIKSSKVEETRLDSIWGVGNYAVGARWGDGHATGIYTFTYLRGLAHSEESSPRVG